MITISTYLNVLINSDFGLIYNIIRYQFFYFFYFRLATIWVLRSRNKSGRNCVDISPLIRLKVCSMTFWLPATFRQTTHRRTTFPQRMFYWKVCSMTFWLLATFRQRMLYWKVCSMTFWLATFRQKMFHWLIVDVLSNYISPIDVSSNGKDKGG